MWKNKADAHAAADRLIEDARHLEVPSWSNRSLQLAGAAAPVAKVTVELGPVHRLTMAFHQRLRERLDVRAYGELWRPVMDAELRITSSRRYRWQPEGLAD